MEAQNPQPFNFATCSYKDAPASNVSMAQCRFCNNLNIPSYETVARSRPIREYNGVAVVPGTAYLDIKPNLTIKVVDILSGADQHCNACIMLKHALLKTSRRRMKRLEEVDLQASLNGTLGVTVIRKTGFEERYEFYTSPQHPSSWPIIGAGRQVHPDSSSDACIELAAAWIKDCIDNHHDCLKIDCTPLPTRVINVGSEHIEPYLYISKQEHAQYIALSHCWGDITPVQTTIATFEERVHEVRLSNLPKTFQDAIIISRKLKVQYLWIDSLCIIQDSKEDWERESVNMGSIYRNSLVCIAAEGALDADGGCFIEGHPSRNLDIASIGYPVFKSPEMAVHIRRRSNTMGGQATAHVGLLKKAYMTALDTRGWVLQEQALARRTLHYTVAELSWDCATYVQCECTVLPEKVEMSFANMQLRACKQMIQHSKKPTTQSLSDGSKWPNFVELFTKRRLTYNTDKLHALSGLAASMSPPGGGSFLAGLWREELPLGLLWRTKPSYYPYKEVVSRRHPEYYAPSWSWASVTAPIEYITLPGQPLNFKLVPDLKIIEAVCALAGENPYGPVQSGHLKVTGLLVPFDMPTKSTKINKDHLQDSKQASLRRGFDYDVYENGEALDVVDGEPLWFLLIAHGERINAGFSKVEGHHCIVVRKSRLDMTAFERIGCAWALKDEWEFDLSKRANLQTIVLH